MPLIEVNEVRKVFETTVRRQGRFGTLASLFRPEKRQVAAVEQISFAIERGESVAYLGPNGAGKSTTIKMLTGILEPSAGSVEVAGLIPHRNRKRSSYQIGVVFGQRSQLLFDLPVKDSYELLRYMYSVSWERYHSNLKEFADILEVEHLMDRPVRTLSLGQRMRCEILAALLHDPDILFLDEPTIGLDVVAKERIRSFIEKINREKGVTLLLTTHDMNDIERLCHRTMIIDKGRLIYDGSLQYIKDNFATERQIRAAFSDVQAARAAALIFHGRPGVAVEIEEQVVRVTYDQQQTDTSELLKLLLDKANPRDLTMQDESVDALISRIYREGLEERPKNRLLAAEGALR
ncbi:ABC transporter ATP-binding protein [Paenibacillus xerothermodurans]|uniref:ATP-binding cassette domain-containing protein n=1 Tax=Paenibacillus xerothermodurans TaxID=1977292 RepID=A0A2W1N8V2_PAEXE|nr:ATP-binding cassette domain-containing protein [Paenibacillus xerothermodurans]PZE21049.1 ATP-binding cassette domain-containing protein [Paenibacillus xerothermodurans]